MTALSIEVVSSPALTVSLSLASERDINLDIPSAVITVLGVVKEVRELRTQIVSLPGFEAAAFDRLRDYALATGFANAQFLSALKEADEVGPLTDEAAMLRERYLAEAHLLTHRGIVAESQLENLKGATSRKNISTDLLVLVGLLQDNWSKIEGKSHTTREDLEHAKLLVTALQTILGSNEQGPGVVALASDRRRRAYTRSLARTKRCSARSRTCAVLVTT